MRNFPTSGSWPLTRPAPEAGRDLPAALRDALELLPRSSHPMDVLRTGVSVLGCLEPEKPSSTPRLRHANSRIG